MTSTTAVLLAAGAGNRLGLGTKGLLPFRGSTLVAHAATALLRGGCSEVVIVIGSEAAKVRATPLPPGCRFVENPRWEEGMGSSLATGLAAVGNADCILVALVDQPGMDADVIATLLAAHKTGRITAAGYRDASHRVRRGNPVLFSHQQALQVAAQATGDTGARAYLSAHPELVDVIDLSHLSDGADIDTREDLHLLK